MEGGGFFPLGGDPEEILRGLREFAETQSESVKEAQREQFATLTLSTAVELTAAALKQVQPTGGPDEQAAALRDAMRVLFPEAVALVSAARQGFMRELSEREPRPTAVTGRPGATHRVPLGVFDRAVATVLPAVPRSLVRRVSAPYIAGPTLDDARRTVARSERRREARDGRRARRGGAHRRRVARRSRRPTATCSRRSTTDGLDANISVKLTGSG